MSETYCGNCGNAVQPNDRFCQKCGAPLELKTATTENPQPIRPTRGGCLSLMLIGMLILSPLAAIDYFISISPSVGQPLSNLPPWIRALLGTSGLAQFVFVIAIWKWKKWGMYGLAGLSVIVFLLNAIYISILSGILGLAGVATIAFLLRKTWNQMQ